MDINRLKNLLKANASTLLMAVASGGVILTAYFASKESAIANKRIENAQRKKDREFIDSIDTPCADISEATLTRFEKLKIAAPCYIKTYLCAAIALTCMWGSHQVDARTITNVTAAYSALHSQFSDYRHEANNLYGEDADSKIRQKVAQSRAVNNIPVSDSRPIIFYEPIFKTTFISTFEKVKIAEGEMNRLLTVNGSCSMREFYELLGLEPPALSDSYGWCVYSDSGFDPFNGYYWIDFEHFFRTDVLGDRCDIGYFTGPFTNYLEDLE